MFIVIEGIDGSGKDSQTKRIIKRLEEQGKKVTTMHFPTHENTQFGLLVSAYLLGEYGSKEDLTPEIPSLLYAIDRYQFKDEIQKKIDEGQLLIFNRYTQSNFGFQGAKFEGGERKDFIKWLAQVDSRLPQPDLVIFLDIPPEASLELMNNRKGKQYLGSKGKDIHEEDIEYQRKVRETYLEVAKDEGWVIIDCAYKEGKDWKMKSKEDIHEVIWKEISKRL